MSTGVGCESSKQTTSTTAGSGGSTSSTTTTSSGTAGGTTDLCTGFETVTVMDSASCRPSATDFDPKNTANDGWAACKSDDGIFHPFDVAVGSDKRTVAFDAIGKLLGFGIIAKPDAQAFIDAKVLYVETEGIESRVVRREDYHYPAAPEACNMMTPDEQATYKDRCVGPQKLMPVINQAFTDGAKGMNPTENALKLEAALIWMFYISSVAESNSCEEDLGDCDSASGYYSGSRTRDDAQGFAKYVKAVSPQALNEPALVPHDAPDGRTQLGTGYRELTADLRGVYAELRRQSPWNAYITGVMRGALEQDRLAITDIKDKRIPVGGTPGFTVFDIRVGYRFERNIMAAAVFENLGDAIYRYHGSAVNGAGRSLSVSLEGGL